MNYATPVLRNSKKGSILRVNSPFTNRLGTMTTFHEEIKMRTDAAHAAAETAPFISNLMGGQLSQTAYRDYLLALLPIYERMETLFPVSQGVLQHFDHRALDRASAIKADIAELNQRLGEGSKELLLKSVQRYLDLLPSEITSSRLLAHHYIRYLGDLSGGMAIAKLVSRHYQIPAEGLTFYDFSEIGDAVFYKKRYRDLLNFAPFNEDEKSQFLDEVSKLYLLSREIFLELGEIHRPSES